MNENRIPTEASAGVEVNPEETVTMWLGDISVQVPKSSIGDFQGRGFVLIAKTQLSAVASELRQYAPALVACAERYVKGIEEDGFIDTSDEAEGVALQKALNLIYDRVATLINVANQLYPVRQGTPVVLSNGVDSIQVDPSQVGLYLSEGWRVVEND